MDMLESLAKKKGDKEMDPKRKDAKMKVLKEIHKMASDSMGNDLDGMKKGVTVMAPDQAGLSKGLDLAKAVTGAEGSPEEEASESPEEESHEDGNSLTMHEHSQKPMAEHMIAEQIDHEAAEGDLSDEDIDALIAELQAKKSQHKA